MTARSEWRAKYAAVEEAISARGDRGGQQRDYRVFCPFCVSSKTGRPDASLAFSPRTGKFWCHRCQTGGKLRGYGDPEDDDKITPRRCIQITGGALLAAKPKELPKPHGYIPLGYGEGAEARVLSEARLYAGSRGLTQESCADLEVGACLEGRYAGRLILPCRHPDGRWWNFVARDFTGRAQIPYLYAEDAPRKDFLLHVGALESLTLDPVLAVEGWFDTVPYPGDSVAFLGKPSEDQIGLLARSDRPVCIVLDGDAWRLAEAITLRLRMEGQTAGFVRLPPKKDPDQLDPSWLRAEALASLQHPF